MLGLPKKLYQGTFSRIVCLLVILASLAFGLTQPAYADNAQIDTSYIAADGTDLTAIAQCLPKELSQPNLARALRESGNDFLQKVFSTKADYDNYKIEAEEAQYLNCLKAKGFTPAVKR
ncbi:hypothetical protein [Vacuolonema iberomarrocanum]|uniref:hypothetical protein n=1 Tax=Vacuolonema iberomarrocanum TaxID=3454632 RepID=UPI0019F297A1|nr:hypothetical protein [filamentous cyanobacterium LEGE 07170]